jgi:hypothetical protein
MVSLIAGRQPTLVADIVSLERFQEKWLTLFRFERTTARETGASVPIRSERKLL